MGDVKLTSPRVHVVRDGYDPLDVQTDNRDLVLWDRTRVKHRWPKFDEAPFVWLTFISWAAARRTGAIELGHTYERWESEVVEVTTADDDDESDPELGRPTQAGREPA
jgi:hypothetical protein